MQAWLQEYMAAALPSVPLEALGESCFTQAPVTHSPTLQEGAVAHAGASAVRAAAPEVPVPPAKPDSDRVLNLKTMFDGIYLGDAPSPTTAPPPLKLPVQESDATAGKVPRRPPSTPGSDRLKSGGKRMSAEKALQRATLSCLLYTSPSPRDRQKSRMPSSA